MESNGKGLPGLLSMAFSLALGLLFAQLFF